MKNAMDNHTQSGIATMVPLLAGIVRDSETGELRWPLIVGSLVVAAVVAVAGLLLKISSEVAANTSMIVLLNADLRDLKSSVHPATAKRYTSDDATRDLELIRARIKDARDEVRRDVDDLSRRIIRLEDRVRR